MRGEKATPLEWMHQSLSCMRQQKESSGVGTRGCCSNHAQMLHQLMCNPNLLNFCSIHNSCRFAAFRGGIWRQVEGVQSAHGMRGPLRF